VPIASPGPLAAGLVAVMVNVASRYPYQVELGVYYGVPALTFFGLGFLAVLARLFRRGLAGSAAAAIILVLGFARVDLPVWRQPIPADRVASAVVAELAAEQGPVSVNSVLVPHLPRDRPVYLFPEVRDAGVVALYFRPGDDGPWLVEPREFFAHLVRLLERGDFGVRFFDGNVLVVERGSGRPEEAATVVQALRARYPHAR